MRRLERSFYGIISDPKHRKIIWQFDLGRNVQLLDEFSPDVVSDGLLSSDKFTSILAKSASSDDVRRNRKRHKSRKYSKTDELDLSLLTVLLYCDNFPISSTACTHFGSINGASKVTLGT